MDNLLEKIDLQNRFMNTASYRSTILQPPEGVKEETGELGLYFSPIARLCIWNARRPSRLHEHVAAPALEAHFAHAAALDERLEFALHHFLAVFGQIGTDLADAERPACP